MLLKKVFSVFHSLAFQLTLWYGAIFALSTLVAFLVIYMVLSSVLHTRIDQSLMKEFNELSSLKKLKGIEAVVTQMNLDAESKGVNKIFFRIASFDGKEVASSNLSSWRDAGIGKAALRKLAGGLPRVFETIPLSGQPHKVRLFYGSLDSGNFLQIGRSLDEDERFMAIIRRIFVLTGVVLMFSGGLIGWFMGNRALRGIEAITQTALKISEGALEHRAYVKTGGVEVERLASAFNSMLDRIHVLITEMREITDNIAHDLKTPITRIRGFVETTLKRSGSFEEQEAIAIQAMEECDRLVGIVNTMLDISEAEAGAGKFHKEEVDMAEIVRDASDLFLPIAEDKGLRFITSLPDHVFIQGDLRKLQRMVANLLDNALKFTPPEGIIRISIERNQEMVVISFSDTGIGISPHNLPRIFDRFYQCDQSRSRGGVGLGLSLARAIVRSHGGDITVMSTLGEGSQFTITLP